MKFKIQKFQSIDSTNKYALENSHELENYTVISAQHQTSGKGRKGRKWISTDGSNLYFSLIIKEPNIKTSELSGIPQLMALAVYKTLHKAGIKKSWIKWPNDVFVEDKKICGILCESRFKGTEIDALIIGVGVNVNSSQENLSQIDVPATSIHIESNDKAPYNSDELLHVILNYFDKDYQTCLNENNRISFKEEWRNASNLIGKPVKLLDDEKEIFGTVADFSTTGEIILQTERGFQTYSYGDLSLRKV